MYHLETKAQRIRRTTNVIWEQGGENKKLPSSMWNKPATQSPLSTAPQRNSNVPKVKTHAQTAVRLTDVVNILESHASKPRVIHLL